MAKPAQPFYRILYVQVLMAVAAGILLGYFFPALGKAMQPLGEAFIKLIKMLIAPIIFCTVVHGIASLGDLRKVGRIGGKTILYFEAVSTLALLLGLLVVNLVRPGDGFNIDPRALDPQLGHSYAQKAEAVTLAQFFLNLIPVSLLTPLVSGDLLPLLLVSILIAFAIAFLGETGKPILHAIDQAGRVFFGVMRLVVKAAPVGAFGAMAFTVGSFGVSSLNRLFLLMVCFYLTALLFIGLVLGAIAWLSGFSILRFIAYIKEELLLVLGTSSSETALPGMIEKMTQLGCARSTVGLVIPTGYSFNLDGTNIYMTVAALFLAQATNIHLDWRQQTILLLTAMVTSKGASGVTGSGFVTLAATLAVVPSVPVAALALIVGIDRFMSECRALTNLVGNGVATVVISRWENEVTKETLNKNLQRRETVAFESKKL
jgi:aerobic C4-dicarboxylate transport protein